MERERPNLLFVITDQEQARTTEGPARLPALERLRARGVSFSRACTVNAIRSPPRASILTGVLPPARGMVDCTHTVENYRARSRADLPTWSRMLREAGWRTAYYGKWHIERSEKLDRFGFDVHEICDLAADPHETRNLAADPGCAPALEEMSARMWEIMRATGDHNMFNAQYPMFRFAPTGPEG